MVMSGSHDDLCKAAYPLHCNKRGQRLAALLTLTCGILLLAGCGMQSYRGVSVDTAAFLQRAIVQEDADLRVTAAVPDAAETLALTGLDLYKQGIQPVWLKVENRGTNPVRTTMWSIDRDYFSPIEVAYMNRKRFSSAGYDAMQRWFYDNGLQRQVPAGESRSGLVFTHLKPGTKGFNVDIFRSGVSHSFTFFVPMPGFVPDYMQVDFATLYDESEIRQLDTPGLKRVLQEEFPCCAGGPGEGDVGGPLNVVFVATPSALRRSLLRARWQESQAESDDTRRARARRFEGRPPDAIFHLRRKDGNEKLGLLLWRAPWDVDGQAGWVGTVYYTVLEETFLTRIKSGSAIRDSEFLSRFVNESLAADLDSASRFLAQNFWYSQSLAKLGIVTGAGEAGVDNPQVMFDGLAYLTDGLRYVLFLSETPVALDDMEQIYGRDYLIDGARDE
jgi:hypothetical protein